MKSLSFDSMVDFYDETRVFDRDCFDSALDFLVDKFTPERFGSIFYPGIGTGRIAIPLAERGYRVAGVDISTKMLALLKKRLMQSRQPLRISFQRADVVALPFRDAAFDIAICVHLFYFIPNWPKAVAEILRVVRRDGPVILMHTGTGMELPFLNARYKELCTEQGCLIEEIGVKSTREVTDYVNNLGCDVEWLRDRWQWTSRIRLDSALCYVKSRAYSFTTIASDDIHSRVIKKLESELQHRFGSLTTEVEVPNQINFFVVLRRG